jgi:hypothetical protein
VRPSWLHPRLTKPSSRNAGWKPAPQRQAGPLTHALKTNPTKGLRPPPPMGHKNSRMPQTMEGSPALVGRGRGRRWGGDARGQSGLETCMQQLLELGDAVLHVRPMSEVDVLAGVGLVIVEFDADRLLAGLGPFGVALFRGTDRIGVVEE